MPVYVATAYAVGPDCTNVAVLLVVRLRDDVRHVDAINARDGLASSIDNAAQLQDFLRDWLAPRAASLTSAQLPPWSPDSEETTQLTTDENGNFFTPAVGRAWYARVRAMDVPLLCYARVQGNLTCYAFVNSGLEKIGAYEHED
ncbi:hypothetical protein [Candidatus Viadribacter manganicus]|nr:hypothetical protein [Candidatus Viadribacter manganicus]